MTDPLTLSVVSILGKYAVDAGVTLAKEVGPAAVRKAGQLLKAALDHLRQKPEGKVIADGYEHKPDVYAAPLQDMLEDAIRDDEDLKRQLQALVSAYDQERVAYRASLTGSGAIAQGPGATAVGERGVYVGRDAGVVITGDSNAVSAGGDIVGGDKIDVGHISGSSGIAIGRGATASVSRGVSGAELHKLFAPLLDAANAAPAGHQAEATSIAEALEQEANRGDKADDTQMASLVERLISLAPATTVLLKSIFDSPLLANLAGPVTSYVLGKIQEDQS